MYKTSLRKVVVGAKKKAIQRHPIILSCADYDHIMDEIECLERLSLKGMWLLTMMMNQNDDNNNNEIFNVGFHYIIIKNEYVNIICIFMFFLWI